MSNSRPFLTGFVTSLTIDEDTANLTPQLIDSDVSFVAPDSNFDGSTLVVSGLLADDIVSIRDKPTGEFYQIGFSGGVITFGGVIIGSATGGAGSPLSITFNANATAWAIDALIESLTFATLSDTPVATRTLELTITDANGARTAAGVTVAHQTGAANPFDGIDIGGQNAPTLADIDGDGDLDMLIGGISGTFNYYENTGTALAPAYTERTGGANPFNGIAGIGFKLAPKLADLDGDGDVDLVIGEQDGTLNFYENTGTRLAPAYTLRTGGANPFDGIDVGSDSIPSFADLDGDGDLDLVIGAQDGTLKYYENTGSALAPIYTERTGAGNPLDGIVVIHNPSPTFADLDGDGDLDMIIGEDAGRLVYYENTGTRLAPAYTERTNAENPFNGLDVGFYSAPVFADLDRDGDLDLVIGDWEGNLSYYANTTIRMQAVYTEQTGAANPFDGIDVGFFAAPHLVDLDGDGDLDLVIGELHGTLNYYENTGTGLAPIYTERTDAANPFDGIDVALYSAPILDDLDGDGDLDLIIGRQDGTLSYFENTGTAMAPIYTERTGGANPFNGIDIGSFSLPSFTDLDVDGDLDLIIGEGDGNLNYYENTGTGLAPVYTERTGTDNPFHGINIGTSGTPNFADLDGDGDLDLIIGESDGNLNYYERTASGLRFALNVTPHDDPSEAADVITGTAGNDTIFALGGDDTVRGLGGNDVLVGGSGNDTMIGGAGDDTYLVGEAGDVITELAGEGNDVVYITDVAGYTLSDHVEVGAAFGSTLNITGNSGANTLIGNSLGNVLSGEGGDDVIYGVAGGNSLFGGAGNDVFVSGTGADGMAGGTGDDVYIIGAGDIVTENPGEGTDTVYSSLATYFMTENVEIGVVNGGTALIGNASNNTLIGDGSFNVLSGLGGSDFLVGGAGGDLLIGGNGLDTMQGNSGGDVFWWTAMSELGDIIQDWVNTEDQLQFTAGAFFNFAGATLIEGINFISSANPFATTANATFLWDSDDTNLFFDPDGNGAAGRILVADFQAFTTLGVSDFQFV